MSGLIGAGADLGGTLIGAVIRALLEVLATVFIIAMAVYVVISGLRHRKRRYPAAEDSGAMLDRWQDEPEVIPDALSLDLARWLAEGDSRG